MSSPAKKRKKNDFKPSGKSVRSLDYFFTKQRQDQQQTATSPLAGQPTSETPLHDSVATQLNDEELARKLQEEWNREDVTRSSREPEEQKLSESTSSGDNEQRTSERSLPANPAIAVRLEAAAKPPRDAAEAEKNTLKLQSTATAEDTITSNIPFDQTPLTFEPSKYITDLQSHWSVESRHATYAVLTRCFVLVNSTQSRIKIVDTLVNLLRTVIESDPDSLLPAVSKYQQ